jgi:hypothetical protein
MRLGSLEEIWAGSIPEGTEIGTDSIRLFVSLYTGIPFIAEEETLMPKSAVRVLESEGKTNDPRFSAIKEQAIELTIDENVILAAPALEITGNTTVQEVLDAGFSLSLIETILGTVDNKRESIKVLAESQGLSFSEVKLKILE